MSVVPPFEQENRTERAAPEATAEVREMWQRGVEAQVLCCRLASRNAAAPDDTGFHSPTVDGSETSRGVF